MKVLAEGRNKLLKMFQSMFNQAENITDAENVDSEIVRLIELKAPRLLRTQVGSDMGVSAINEQTQSI